MTTAVVEVVAAAVDGVVTAAVVAVVRDVIRVDPQTRTRKILTRPQTRTRKHLVKDKPQTFSDTRRPAPAKI